MRKKERLIIALAGPISSGKSHIAKYLVEELKFKCVKTRDIITDYLTKAGYEVNDKNLQNFGAQMMEGSRSEDFCGLLAEKLTEDSNWVIDSLRPIHHYNFLKKELQNFYLIYIVASEELRLGRYKSRLENRSNSTESFNERVMHPVEKEIQKLMFLADLIVNNAGEESFRAILKSFILSKMYRDEMKYFQEVIDSVEDFHRKFNYGIGDGKLTDISIMVGLMVEELGEIHECLTKDKGSLSEELADLLYLLIGSCVTFGIDIEKAFDKVHQKNMSKVLKKLPYIDRPKLS